jgi:hypothetical protein
MYHLHVLLYHWNFFQEINVHQHVMELDQDDVQEHHRVKRRNFP